MPARLGKAPTRRQIAMKVAQSVPVLNAHSQALAGIEGVLEQMRGLHTKRCERHPGSYMDYDALNDSVVCIVCAARQCMRELDTHWARLDRVAADLKALRSMGFWARVRWIVWGIA